MCLPRRVPPIRMCILTPTVRRESLPPNIFAIPPTYVVDRSGNIVGEPIVGAITEKKQAETLQKLIDQALAADMG